MSKRDELAVYDARWSEFVQRWTASGREPFVHEPPFGHGSLSLATNELPERIRARLADEIRASFFVRLSEIHEEDRAALLKEVVEEARATLAEFEGDNGNG